VKDVLFVVVVVAVGGGGAVFGLVLLKILLLTSLLQEDEEMLNLLGVVDNEEFFGGETIPLPTLWIFPLLVGVSGFLVGVLSPPPNIFRSAAFALMLKLFTVLVFLAWVGVVAFKEGWEDLGFCLYGEEYKAFNLDGFSFSTMVGFLLVMVRI